MKINPSLSLLLLTLSTLFLLSCEVQNNKLTPVDPSLEQTKIDATISVYPDEIKQSLQFGGDGKLTIKDWSEQALEETSIMLYKEMNLNLVRIPIFTRLPIEDTIYEQTAAVVKAIQQHQPEVLVFASVANGDGYDNNNLHREKKFPDDWIGCCPENVYQLDLEQYAKYLDAFMLRMKALDVPIHYLGPFNEDRAFAKEYEFIYNQMQELGETQQVSLERYHLAAAVDDQAAVETQADIIGSHYFDDADRSKGVVLWQQLVNEAKHPVWFTESTRFKIPDGIENLVNGLGHIFPAINAGVERVIFYQVIPRFIKADGEILPIKYSGFQSFVNSFGGGRVIQSASSDTGISAVANRIADTLQLHLLNHYEQEKVVEVNLPEIYGVAQEVTVLTWDKGNIAKASTILFSAQQNGAIRLPAQSYLQLRLKIK